MVIRCLGLSTFLAVMRTYAAAAPEFVDETACAGGGMAPGFDGPHEGLDASAGDAESPSPLTGRH